MSNYETLIPSTWAEHLKGGKVCLGLDVASTIEDKSNPSSLTVMEQWEGVYYERLVVRWKTEDMDVMESIIRHVLKPIARPWWSINPMKNLRLTNCDKDCPAKFA